VKLIVGLGNPGIEYQFTPHNMGFLAIDRIAEQCGVKVANRHCKAVTARAIVEGQAVLLAKPETYMNRSGDSVRELLERYEADSAKDLIVLYDDLALPFGSIRVRERGSAGGHNGLKSIIASLDGSQEFLRVRMGVAPEYKLTNGRDYLLSEMRKAQLPVASEALDSCSEAVRMILTLGASAAMNRFNQKGNGAGQAE
jgi:PTH1 family peptidyl-tRNA hydrolase